MGKLFANGIEEICRMKTSFGIKDTHCLDIFLLVSQRWADDSGIHLVYRPESDISLVEGVSSVLLHIDHPTPYPPYRPQHLWIPKKIPENGHIECYQKNQVPGLPIYPFFVSS